MSMAKEPGTSLDVARMEQLLKDAGVTEYEPRVVGQLLELAYTATRRVLEVAKGVSTHCEKQSIDENDVQLALEFTRILVNKSAERERMIKMAQERNSQPLPAIRHNFGLKLPNDRFCLLQQNVEWRADKADETTDGQMMMGGGGGQGRGGGGGMSGMTPVQSQVVRDSMTSSSSSMSTPIQRPKVRPENVVNLLKRPAPDDYD